MTVVKCWPMLLALPLAAGCQQGDDEGGHTPAWVVQEFIERMGAVHGESQRAKAAYDLLWSRAQANLQERANRASALLGRLVEPEEMIVPSRFALQFVPKTYTTVPHGDWATVTVAGGTASREVRCVTEDGVWKVVVDFPPPRLVEKRHDIPGSGQQD